MNSKRSKTTWWANRIRGQNDPDSISVPSYSSASQAGPIKMNLAEKRLSLSHSFVVNSFPIQLRIVNLTFVYEQNPYVPKVQQRHPILENCWMNSIACHIQVHTNFYSNFFTTTFIRLELDNQIISLHVCVF